VTDNVVRHEGRVSPEARERASGQKGALVWLTGLSASGKSTIARQAEEILFNRGVWTYVLDGDNLRHGLNSDLGFGQADRVENVRRVGEAARLFADAGLVVFVALISPYRADRERVRTLFGAGRFMEVYVKCPLSACEERDPKGLYVRARAGEIAEFTGLDSPYEEPDAPELALDTMALDIGDCAAKIVGMLEERGIVRGS